MPGVLFGLGALVVLLAAAASKAKAASSPAPALLPAAAHVKKIVASKNPRAIAAAAVVAHKAGQPELARDLAKHARSAAATHPAQVHAPALPGVTPAAWTAFVRVLRGPDAKAITPTYQLGMFRFGMRRLVDLGLAHNAHRREYQGRQVWDANWVPALEPGPTKFLDDPDLQLKTFGRSMLAYAHQIVNGPAAALIGSTLDGKPVTLSGLLAVAHQAGFQGLTQWASDPKVRAQFPQTMAIYQRANGLF
jgi:hypothetical protein